LQRVQHDLQVHGYCQELPLQPLTQDHIEEYLRSRFNGTLPLHNLAQLIYARTEGNPLFMVNVTDYLLTQEEIARRNEHSKLPGDCIFPSALPTTLQQMIERQLDRLSPEERRVLEAASVAGVEFSTAAVAAGLAENVVEVEQTCERLARQQQFLQRVGAQQWPDGTVGICYRFFHSLYQQVLYEQITTGRRIRLHQQIGERTAAE
jgi:predicted ATPase